MVAPVSAFPSTAAWRLLEAISLLERRAAGSCSTHGSHELFQMKKILIVEDVELAWNYWFSFEDDTIW
jgi:hypothetical protein